VKIVARRNCGGTLRVASRAGYVARMSGTEMQVRAQPSIGGGIDSELNMRSSLMRFTQRFCLGVGFDTLPTPAARLRTIASTRVPILEV
jgi:hypothetical protein